MQFSKAGNAKFHKVICISFKNNQIAIFYCPFVV